MFLLLDGKSIKGVAKDRPESGDFLTIPDAVLGQICSAVTSCSLPEAMVLPVHISDLPIGYYLNLRDPREEVLSLGYSQKSEGPSGWLFVKHLTPSVCAVVKVFFRHTDHIYTESEAIDYEKMRDDYLLKATVFFWINGEGDRLTFRIAATLDDCVRELILNELSTLNSGSPIVDMKSMAHIVVNPLSILFPKGVREYDRRAV